MGLGWIEVKKIIKDFKPDVVGISIMFTAYFDDALRLAKVVKAVNKKIYVVMGGSHVSTDPKACVTNKDVDFAVYGEGEKTMEELLMALEKKKPVGKIKGMAYKTKTGVAMNPPRELVKNLDDIPFPAWDMLNISKYDLGEDYQMRRPTFYITSSRGCPMHCAYCSSFAVWQHRWRGRSAQNVVDEIELLVKSYGAKEIAFFDDSISVDRKRLVEICNEIIKRKLNIRWSTPNGIAHWTLDKDLIKLMRKAGCYRITFGIESGDVETRRFVGKPFDLNQAKELTKYANSLGMWTLATNIIGFPYETKEQIDRTLKYAIDSGVDIASFFRLGLRPGAPVYDIFEKEGWLPKDKEAIYKEDMSCKTKYFSPEDLQLIQKEMFSQFYTKRWGSPLALIRLIPKIKSWEEAKYAYNQWKYVAGLRRYWTDAYLAMAGADNSNFRV